MPAGVWVANRGKENEVSPAAATLRSTSAPTPLKIMDKLALLNSSRSVSSSKKSPISSGRNVTVWTEPHVRHSTHSKVNGTDRPRPGLCVVPSC